MKRNRKPLLRAAEHIRARLASIRSPLPLQSLPHDCVSRCNSLCRQSQFTHLRGLDFAAAIVRERYFSTLNRLIEQLREIQSQACPPHHGRTVPSLRHIYDELVAVDQEFGGIRIDSKGCILAVTSGPIVLQEIDLGPFEIRLHWDRLGQSRCYDAVALRPNPASSDDSITHPHVRSDALCEGDGHASIERALREGRLYDFYAIVNRILHTYSAASPYVPLDEWSGVPCDDCGSVSNVEDATRCAQCNDTLCPDCRTSCEGCACDFCHSCVGSCRICDSILCRDCLTSCACCNKRCCSGCLSDSDLCEECEHDQEPEPDELVDDSTINNSAPAPTSEPTPAEIETSHTAL